MLSTSRASTTSCRRSAAPTSSRRARSPDASVTPSDLPAAPVPRIFRARAAGVFQDLARAVTMRRQHRRRWHGACRVTRAAAAVLALLAVAALPVDAAPLALAPATPASPAALAGAAVSSAAPARTD